jgi:DNA-binding NtrC family response regulator
VRTELIARPVVQVALRLSRIRVEVVAGNDLGLTADPIGPEVRIGTAASNHLVLTDPTVSRHHATLASEHGTIRVIDAHSSNGTFLDGVRVRDADARPDSLIQLGSTSIRFRLLDDVVELPLSSRERFGGLLGRSIAMRRVFAVLERIAGTDDAVLLEGETGTGKELAAEAIHEHSSRVGGPFVVFDCSAVAPNLLESELFGHVRGAFTGAVADRAGVFERADGGTLFIDEVGELPIELQPRLLRALERFEVRRVGGNTPVVADVRVIAATNRSLEQEIARGRFREDLYYRLAVVRVALPPLRERTDDIPMLAEHFAKTLPSRGRAQATLSEATLHALTERAWKGNVRELRNAVARALSLGSTADVAPTSVPPPPPAAAAIPPVDISVPLKDARDRMVEAFERAYLLEVINRAGGNLTRAAELAGVHRKFIQRAVRAYGLRGDRDD